MINNNTYIYILRFEILLIKIIVNSISYYNKNYHLTIKINLLKRGKNKFKAL